MLNFFILITVLYTAPPPPPPTTEMNTLSYQYVSAFARS